MAEVKTFEVDGELRECVVVGEHPTDPDLIRVRTRGHNPVVKWVRKDRASAGKKKDTKTTNSEEGEGQTEGSGTQGDDEDTQGSASGVSDEWPEDLDGGLRKLVDKHGLKPSQVREFAAGGTTWHSGFKGIGKATAAKLVEAAG